MKLTSVLIVITFMGYGQNSFIIENVKVFDGEAVFESTSVKIENGVIIEIADVIKVDGETVIIDGKEKTLIPALSNAHVHAWLPGSLGEAAKAGVLNVMDMHGMEPYQGMLRQLKDSTNFARFYVAGYAATAPEGHGTQYGFTVPTITGPKDAKKFIEDRVKANADHIKIIVTPSKATLDSETVAELIKEAHKAEKIAVVHVSRLEDAIDVISNDADGLVHLWRDVALKSTKLEQLSKSKTFFVIPTLLTTLKVFEIIGAGADKYLNKEELLQEVKKLYEAGIPILAGTDPPNLGINHGTDLYKELELLSEAGMPTIEVLKSATSNITTAFGLENTGFIKVGYIADLILIDGDPTEDIKNIGNINTVWKKGKQVKL